MSSLNIFQAALDLNGPPGITHPMLQENYAWVDERLRELYYGYSLSSSNCDEYEEVGILRENWAWVDAKLSAIYEPTEDDIVLCPCPAPIAWCEYRTHIQQHCLEEDCDIKRTRSESDISDYEEEAKRAISRCQSPVSKYEFSPVSPMEADRRALCPPISPIHKCAKVSFQYSDINDISSISYDDLTEFSDDDIHYSFDSW